MRTTLVPGGGPAAAVVKLPAAGDLEMTMGAGGAPRSGIGSRTNEATEGTPFESTMKSMS
jgi:hypothetical protein